jgi:hypothetical protein
MSSKHKSSEENSTTEDSSSDLEEPAVPPPDDPMRRAVEFDPDRDFQSRELAEKRLEAIRKTHEMPTSSDESSSKES